MGPEPDDPTRRIAERECCSERTLHHRIYQSIAAILQELGEVVDNPEGGQALAKAHLPNFMREWPTVSTIQAVNQHGT